MVKDVLNHPTWNNIVFKETGGDVDKFMEKYGQLDFEKL
jgi:ribosomal protein L31